MDSEDVITFPRRGRVPETHRVRFDFILRLEPPAHRAKAVEVAGAPRRRRRNNRAPILIAFVASTKARIRRFRRSTCMISPDRRRRDYSVSPRGVARARRRERRRRGFRGVAARALRRRGKPRPAVPGDPGSKQPRREFIRRGTPRTRTRRLFRLFARLFAPLRCLRVVPAHRLRRGEPPRDRGGQRAHARRRRRHGGGGGIVRPRLASREHGFVPFPRGRRVIVVPEAVPEATPRVERPVGARRRAARRRRRRGRPRRRRRRPKREALAFARRFRLGVAALLVARLHDAGRRRLAPGREQFER